MTHSGEIGFLASALVLAAFGMKDMVNLRIVAICSNVAFIAYALVLDLPPILLLHVMLLPLNGWRLAQALQCSHRELGGLALVKMVNDIRQRIVGSLEVSGSVTKVKTLRPRSLHGASV